MEDYPSLLPHKQKRLNKSEALELFIDILSDVHSTKVSLVNELPFIVSMAFAKDVKLQLLESATAINGQLIRVSLTKALLGLNLNTTPPILNGCLNLDRYLKENVRDTSSKTDVIILTHLVIAEGIEIDAFKVLLQLARAIKTKGVAKLMLTCCQEAKQSKKALKAMLAFYD